MNGLLPPVPPVAEIQERLLHIFPDGTPNRGYCTREIAAKTVFVMLYIGAIDGRDRYLRPNQVTRMTDAQAKKMSEAARSDWAKKSLRKGGDVRGRWYAVDTREPIRDETLRDGLVRTGAASARKDLPTTSSAPRYALTRSFAALFDPALTGDSLANTIVECQSQNLTAGALARIQLVGRGATASASGIVVTFPNSETRRLALGPSSVISKAVVEEFASRFLGEPGLCRSCRHGWAHKRTTQRGVSTAHSRGRFQRRERCICHCLSRSVPSLLQKDRSRACVEFICMVRIGA